MNKITTLAAISMFAVMMGMAAFSPAFASGSNGQKTTLCHFEDEHLDENDDLVPAEWVVIEVNDRSLPAHEGHGDLEIVEADPQEGQTTEQGCMDFNNPA